MYSWPKMQFKYGQGHKGFSYQQEEDAFLLTMMHRHGFGAARRIQLEIRRAWQFRFDWFFKSRSPQEIQKRCDVLIRVVEREVQEHQDKEAEKEEEARRKLEEGQRRLEEAQKRKEAEEQLSTQLLEQQPTSVQANVNPPP